jgi:hypothetical protein
MAAACAAALGAWAAFGTLAYASPSGPRLGILPPVWVAGLFLVGATVAARRWTRLPAAPAVLGGGLLLLPWLPIPVPAAFLAWSRPLTTFLAAAVLIAAGVYLTRHLPPRVRAAARDPRRAPVMVTVLSIVLYGAAAWRAAPMIPGGDEPHYLIITQSLLYDFDLRIENNHARGDYRAYHAGDLKPDFLQRGVDGEIYSVHMPGISALVAPAFLVGGHAGTMVLLVLLASLAGALLWRIAWMVTGDAAAAWFGWAAAALSVPVVFHSFTVYPDSAGMLFVLVGMAGLLRAASPGATARPISWVGYGAALAVLPWFHSRFAMLAGVLGALTTWRLLRAPRGGLARVGSYLAVPVASAVAWFGFFHVIYGSPDPRAQYGGFLHASSSPAYVTSGIGGLLLDPQFGLLPYAPVFVAAFAGLALMLSSPRRAGPTRDAFPPHRLVGLTILLLVVPYLVSTTTTRMWWGGWSAPARFVVTLLPPLGIAIAVAWQRTRRRATRVVLLGALGLTLATTGLVVWVDRGRLAYNIRQADALWLDWLGPLAALSRGVPTFLRAPEPESWLQSAAWVGLLATAWLVLRFLDGRLLRTRAALGTAAVAAFAVMGMTALSVVWCRNRSSGVEPTSAQVRLLHASAGGSGIGVAYQPFAHVRPGDLPARMTIEPPEHFASGRQHLVTMLPGPLPAGHYVVEPRAQEAAGRVTIGIGREHVPIRTATLSPGMPPIDLSFPVDVRALAVYGDAEAEASGVSFAIRPRAVVRPAGAGPGFAQQARRYGRATVYFMDDRSFPEPPGFWVGGGRDSTVVLQPDEPRGRVGVRLRNAPVPNQVALESGGWREILPLSPGEVRALAVPLDPAGHARLRLTVSGGFRPSEHEAGSNDTRFLGVWLELE